MSESLRKKLNVTVSGDGPLTLLFVHGLGCNQGMWRHVAPHFEGTHRIVMMDLMGCGRSDWSAWDPDRYATLDGHADDLVEVAEAFGGEHTVLVVHSVATMIGLLADVKAPQLFDAHAMVAPSPCYVNAPGYTGGFEPETIDALLELIDRDPPGFARSVAPVIMGSLHPGMYASELEASFCAAHPPAFQQFARTTFRGDFRHRLAELVKPTLVMQCADDVIAPVAVGQYMVQAMPDAHMEIFPVQGHVPHIAAPQHCIAALESFLGGLGLGRPTAAAAA